MSQLETLGIQYDYDGELERAQLNQERIVAACRIALEKLEDYGHRAAVRWFQYEYKQAIEELKKDDENTVMTKQLGLPTLTGHENAQV